MSFLTDVETLTRNNESIIRLSCSTKNWDTNIEEISRYIETFKFIDGIEKINDKVLLSDKKLGLASKVLLYKAIVSFINNLYPTTEVEDINKAIKFEYNQYGKPRLSNMEGFQFNLSHSGDFVFLVAGFTGEVGVDVMKICIPNQNETATEFISWFKDELSDIEYRSIEEANNHSTLEYNQLNRFMEIWCLKESIIKALGVGLSCPIPLRNLSFNLKKVPFTVPAFKDDYGSIPILIDSFTAIGGDHSFNGWRFEISYLDLNHCCCLAYSSSILLPLKPVRIVDIQDLI